MRRLEINITPIERAGRIAIGAAVASVGLVLLASAGGVLAVVLEVVVVLAGLDLVVTGVLGHCPLYRKLGYMPPSLRGRHEPPRASQGNATEVGRRPFWPSRSWMDDDRVLYPDDRDRDRGRARRDGRRRRWVHLRRAGVHGADDARHVSRRRRGTESASVALGAGRCLDELETIARSAKAAKRGGHRVAEQWPYSRET